LSSTNLARPRADRLRRRLTALAASLAIGLAGLTAAAAPAHADAVVQITGPADSVPADTPYTLTVSVQGVPNDVGIYLEVDLVMGVATFTGTSGDCAVEDAYTARCFDVQSSSVTYSFTVLPTAGGSVTAVATAAGDVYGSDQVITSIDPVPVPTVTSISPDSGPATGGTPITITGTNLAGTTMIDFGPAGPATDVSCTATTCTAVTPSAAAGLFTVQIETPYGITDDGEADDFTYTPGITIADSQTATGFGTLSTAPFDTYAPARSSWSRSSAATGPRPSRRPRSPVPV
jgi:hypothetical protein